MGCLLWLVLLVGAGYVALQLGRPYVQAWRFEDAIQGQGAAAETNTDAEIRSFLAESAVRLDIPLEARDIVIRRGREHVTISTQWSQDVQLPGYRRTLTFHPEVQALLLDEPQ
ncbi:MAG: hypothetical protein ABR599_05150 [Gemmatimonadota bacterium]